MPADAADIFKFHTHAGFDYVGKAAEAVKEMQKLETGQSQFHSAREHFKGRINYPSTPQQQNNMDNATILAEKYDELISIYKKINTDIFVETPKFLLKGISELATKHYEILADGSYTKNMNYGEIAEPLREIHDDFFQVVALIGAIAIFDNNYETLKNAAQILNKEKEEFSTLKNSMIKQHESWQMGNLKLKEEIGKLKKEAGEVLELAKETLESAKEVSTNAAIDELAAFFKEQGKEHKTKQKHWLWTSIGVTAVLLFCLGLFYYYSPDKWGTQIILQTAIRAFGFSLLLSVLIFCVKNYKAHGHNYIVNTHRVNSLKTYKKIVDGANSPDARDIIMANIAQHIFTPLDTGYVKGADSVGNPTMEIIRSGVKLVDGKE